MAWPWDTVPGRQADPDSIRQHLEWLAAPARGAFDDALIEIAHGRPDHGVSSARLFGLDEIEEAVAFAVAANHRGENVYVGMALRLPDTDRARRSNATAFYLATAIVIDIDENYDETAQAALEIGSPGLVVTTGLTPKRRAQLWHRLSPPCDSRSTYEEGVAAMAAHCRSDQSATDAARLMRLGGTVSRPTRAKIARGYVTEVTTITMDHSATDIDIDGLRLRLGRQSPTTRPAGGPRRMKVSKPASPEKVRNAAGLLTNGREGEMTRQVWKDVHAFKAQAATVGGFTESQSEAAMLTSFSLYMSAVDTNIDDEPGPRADLLEREGRGITAYRKKWAYALKRCSPSRPGPVRLLPPGGVNLPTLSAAEVRPRLFDDIEAFLRRADATVVAQQRHRARDHGAMGLIASQLVPVAPAGERGLVTADLGLGKSSITMELCLLFLDGNFEQDGMFAKAIFPRRIDWRVNSHELARAQEAEFNRLRPGVAAVWLGMEQPSPSGEGAMCRRNEDMRTWRDAGGQPGRMCSRCEHREGCEYLNQSSGAPIIIHAAPGGLTANQVPMLTRTVKIDAMDTRASYGGDLVVIDESSPLSWLGGVGVKPYTVSARDLSELTRPPHEFRNGQGSWHVFDLEKIERLIRRTDVVDDFNPDIRIGELRRIRPTAADWMNLYYEALKLEIEPNNDMAALKGATLEHAIQRIRSWNARVHQYSRFAFVAAQALAVRLPDGREPGDDDACPLMTASGTGDDPVVELRWREPLAPSIEGKPVLILDGTADLQILQQWDPSIRLISDTRARLPDAGVEIMQVWDSLLGYASFAPQPLAEGATPSQVEKNKTAWNNAGRIVDLLDVLTAGAGDAGVAVIAPKRLEEAVEQLCAERNARRPRNLITGHFNAVAGLNVMKDVRVLVVLSRPSPPPRVVENMARAIFTRPVQPLSGWYNRGAGRYIMRDGSSFSAPCAEYHPDPLADRVRALITDGQIEQATGRARLLSRGPGNPALVLIGTAQPTRTPVDRLVEKSDLLRSGPLEALAARGVNVAIGEKGYGPLVAAATGMKVQAVKDEVSRLNVEIPYKDTPIGKFYVENARVGAFSDMFKVQLLAGDRYAPSIALAPGLALRPSTSLAREGIRAHAIRRIRPDGTPSRVAERLTIPEDRSVLEFMAKTAALLACGSAFPDHASLSDGLDDGLSSGVERRWPQEGEVRIGRAVFRLRASGNPADTPDLELTRLTSG